MAINNDLFLHSLWAQGTDAARQILPSSSLNGVDSTMSALYSDPLRTAPSQGAWDTFSGLWGRMALEMALHTTKWTSPFEQFVKDMPYGDTALITGMEVPEMDTYDAHKSALLVRDFGNPHTIGLPINFEVTKTISISEANIRKSFLTPGNLASYMNTQINTILNADSIASYAKFKQVLADAMLTDGFYNFEVPIANVMNPTADELKNLSKSIRLFAGMFTVSMSSNYNAAGLPWVSDSNNLIFITTPAIKSALDVNVLADAFHTSYADIQQKIILIDSLPYENVWGILADKDVLQEHRQIRTIAGMPYDPSTMSFNMSLVHKSAIGYSPFANALCFSSSPTTLKQVVKVTPMTELTVWAERQSGEKITEIALDDDEIFMIKMGQKGGSVDPKTKDIVVPVYGTVSVSGDKPGVLNSRTYVDQFGKLHLQKNIPAGTILTFTAVSTANDNPSDKLVNAKRRKPLTATYQVTIVDNATPSK